ncbi:MAG: pyridoxal phosphate-dependent aminotransferase [Gammaproteobacteria bacterium]|nr:MAG: pyridoxal phosphate-dependent aminotransferase [Gammaproteobacteria bacterium]
MTKTDNHSRRMDNIAPFYVMDIVNRVKELEQEGRDIVRMEVGEPDFVTVEPIIQAGIEALQNGCTKYTSSLGIVELRKKISLYYQEKFGVDVPYERIVITNGASGALMLAMGVLVNYADRVILSDPGYPCNRHFVRMFDGDPVMLPVDASTNYQLSASMVEKCHEKGAKAVLLSTPSNPTGTIIAIDDIARIHQICAANGSELIVDEIYHGLVYDSDPPSAVTVSDDLFVINSFSKYFGMTGWRLGWMVVPEKYVDAIDRLSQNVFLSAPTMAQYAAIEAFNPKTIQILEQRKQKLKKRRDYLLPELQKIGFIIDAEPQGAFYLYADCSKFTDDSYKFCLDLLENAGVAITPGIDFGKHNENKYVRFAYVSSMERLKSGVERLASYLS